MEFIKNLWRAENGHVLTIAFLVALFASLLTGLQNTLARVETTVKSSLAVVVFLPNTATDADVTTLQQTIRSADPEIESIEYTSKEQAFQNAVKDVNLAKSLALLKTNPLPPSLTVRYSDRAWWERPDPTEMLRASGSVQEIRWDPQSLSLFRTLRRWRMWGVRFSGFTGVILLVWVLAGLYRVVMLRSPWSDVMTQVVLGAVGGALAWGLWGVGLRSTQLEMPTLYPAWVWYVPILIGGLAALGCFGMEVRRAAE